MFEKDLLNNLLCIQVIYIKQVDHSLLISMRDRNRDRAHNLIAKWEQDSLKKLHPSNLHILNIWKWPYDFSVPINNKSNKYWNTLCYTIAKLFTF